MKAIWLPAADISPLKKFPTKKKKGKEKAAGKNGTVRQLSIRF
jgi:hypothetical protein